MGTPTRVVAEDGSLHTLNTAPKDRVYERAINDKGVQEPRYDRWGVRIDYAFDGPRLLGTGGALIAALPAPGDAFYVLYASRYLPIYYRVVGQAVRTSGLRGLNTFLAARRPYLHHHGVVMPGRIPL